MAITLSRLGVAVVCIRGNCAGVGSVLEADETRLAPATAPGVADFPVALGCADAYSLYAVVNRLAAGTEDAARVRRPAACVDADRKRASGRHIGRHGAFAKRRGGDGGVACGLHYVFALVCLASAGDTRCWICTESQKSKRTSTSKLINPINRMRVLPEPEVYG